MKTTTCTVILVTIGILDGIGEFSPSSSNADNAAFYEPVPVGNKTDQHVRAVAANSTRVTMTFDNGSASVPQQYLAPLLDEKKSNDSESVAKIEQSSSMAKTSPRAATLLDTPVLMRHPVKTRSETIYGEGIYLRVDQRGRILTSDDTIVCLVRNLGIKTYLRDAIYANGLFVAVGGSYVDEPGVILTSRDGITWIRRRIPVKANLYGVTYGCGLFVAVGDCDTILTSENGVSWKRRRANTSAVLFSGVAYGNGHFIAVGDSGTIVSSRNGVEWYRGSSGTSTYLRKIFYSDGGFVVQVNERTLLISTDGIAWETAN